MKKTGIFSVVVFLVALFLVAESYAQSGTRQRGSEGWGPGNQYGRMYDPKTVETIRGEVVRVDKITPLRAMSFGIHLVVKTEKEKISVHLGPVWFIENQDIKIEAKDNIEVKGSRITFQGNPTIIAAEVKKGEFILKLRDESGFPVWSGWRRRGWR